jgi:uncharacterized protein (DUF1697 family)
MKYLAFLRGINVGGNRKVSMGDLQKLFLEMGFTEVRTLLNSGNVLFASDETEVSDLRIKIEEKLVNVFGWKIGIIIRSQKEIQDIVSKNPFQNSNLTQETRLYVTFVSDTPRSSLKIPYESPEKNFKILQVSNNAIFSILLLSEKYNSTDAMKVLEKEFGKNVTTRNWNTLVKLVKMK